MPQNVVIKVIQKFEAHLQLIVSAAYSNDFSFLNHVILIRLPSCFITIETVFKFYLMFSTQPIRIPNFVLNMLLRRKCCLPILSVATALINLKGRDHDMFATVRIDFVYTLLNVCLIH